MVEANILKELSSQGKKGSLENMVVYGRVRCAIKTPYIFETVQTSDVGAFALLDVFAVKCLQKDYFGHHSTGTYFSKGSMVIFIDSVDWVGKLVKVGGNSFKYGVKIRQQFNNRSDYDGIVAVAWQKQGNNFIISPNVMMELGDKDKDLQLTPMEDIVIKYKATQELVFPDNIGSVAEYVGVEEYEPINTEEVKDVKDTYNASDSKLDLSQMKLDLVYHLNAEPLSEMYEDAKEDLESMGDNRKAYSKEVLKELSSELSDFLEESDDVSRKIFKSFCNKIVSKYSQNIGNSTIKGKVYADAFIQEMAKKPISASDEDKMPSQVEISKGIEMLEGLAQLDSDMFYQGGDNVTLPKMKKPQEQALAVISVTTGIRTDSLESNYASCNFSTGISFYVWFAALLNRPYLMAILGSSLSVVDCDKIMFGFTRFFTDKRFFKESNSDRADLLYLKTLEEGDDKSTFIEKKQFALMKAPYPELGRRFLNQNSFPCKKDYVEALNTLVGKTVALAPGDVKNLLEMPWYSEQRTNRMIENGIVNTFGEDYIGLEKDLEKEFIIYETLIKKGAETTGIMDTQIEGVISEFEESRGFKLEALQRDGIKLCKFKAGVLSGCAGSGKTTTSDCITMCLKKYLLGYKIIYCTPTGKACRRLAEVVGGVVKTINSEFGVGVFGEGYLRTIKKKYEDRENPSKNIYILDEMAMCNTNLMFEVCRSLGSNDMVYFLGDCKQLPPIGKGNPFYTLMRILPCVELGVSKRAAAGSQVNYNVTLVNNCSDEVVEELYYDNDTFISRECSDAEIPRVATNCWKGLMDGSLNGKTYTEDDIQIITGYATQEKSFSTANINPLVQGFLRSGDRLLFRHGDRDFYKNDRVIHSRLNSYGSQRYIEIEENYFKAVLTLGVMNGEVGKVVGFTNSALTRFDDFSEEDIKIETGLYGHLDEEDINKLLEVREARADKIRDDSTLKNDRYYFVKVEVYDSDLKRNVIVLYPARGAREGDLLVLGGDDLNNLDFAYALTTHKMQGSQSKVVICVFGTGCSPTFINRNMLNTMFSRSEEVVVNVGLVKGIDSPITKGRRVASELKTKDLLSYMGGVHSF